MRVTRATAARLAALACSPLLPPASHGWCGDPFPPFAYSLPWFEFAVSGGADMRVVGDTRTEKAKKLSPLLVLPSPPLSYEYLENLEGLTVSERRVAFVSLTLSAAPTASEGPLDALTQQAAAALERLEAPQVHILGHGLGALVALSLLRSRPDRVRSVVLASPLGSVEDADPAQRDALASSPAALLVSSQPKGRACVDAEIARAVPPAGTAAFRALVRSGPALSAKEGPLLMLDDVKSPLLVTRGVRDLSSEVTAASIVRRVPDTKLAVFRSSGSLPQVDEKSAYAEAVLAFLDEADGVRTRRAATTDAMLPGAGRADALY